MKRLLVAAMMFLAAGLAFVFPSVRRYLKIERM
jgi:hypothetical protein